MTSTNASPTSNSQLDRLQQQLADTEKELHAVSNRVEGIDAKVTVYTERMDVMMKDMQVADELREKLHRDVATIQGGVRTLIWLVSSAVAVQVLSKLLVNITP